MAECHREVELYAAAYGGNALASVGMRIIPTVILGPGDMALAHKTNEYIEIEELLTAAEIYGNICQRHV